MENLHKAEQMVIKPHCIWIPIKQNTFATED